MKIENRLVEVSDNGLNWHKRVFVCKKNDRYLVWGDATTLQRAEEINHTCSWKHMREISEFKYRPFTWEDRNLVKGKWIRPKTRVKSEKLITNVFKSTEGWFYVFSDGTALRADTLLKDYEFADGTSCGVLEIN